MLLMLSKAYSMSGTYIHRMIGNVLLVCFERNISYTCSQHPLSQRQVFHSFRLSKQKGLIRCILSIVL